MWIHDATIAQTIAIGAQAFFDLLGNVTISNRAGVVIKRLLLVWQIANVVAGQRLFVDHGVTVTNGDAVTAAVFADPGSQDREGWYFWDGRSYEHASLDDVTTEKVDIRTSRRLPGQDHTLVWVVDNSASSGGSAIVTLNARVLLQLP